MRRSVLALGASIMLIAGACSSGATPAPSSGGGTSAAPSTAAGGGESVAPSSGFDAASISGTAKLAGWQSSDAESAALKDTITAFEAQNSKIKVDYSVVAGDYPTVMATNFASKNVPDLFYVDASYGQTWADQGFLEPLDDYIAKSGFDAARSSRASSLRSRAVTARSTVCRRTATRSASPTTRPTSRPPRRSMDALVSAAQGLKGKDGLKTPMCLNASLDRGLAFIYANGGAIVSDDGSQNLVDTPETTAAVQSYLDLFKNGLGMTASDLGDGWCGDSLGKGHAAMAFEGGWLDPR